MEDKRKINYVEIKENNDLGKLNENKITHRKKEQVDK